MADVHNKFSMDEYKLINCRNEPHVFLIKYFSEVTMYAKAQEQKGGQVSIAE